jgi:hypothetical protein
MHPELPVRGGVRVPFGSPARTRTLPAGVSPPGRRGRRAVPARVLPSRRTSAPTRPAAARGLGRRHGARRARRASRSGRPARSLWAGSPSGRPPRSAARRDAWTDDEPDDRTGGEVRVVLRQTRRLAARGWSTVPCARGAVMHRRRRVRA